MSEDEIVKDIIVVMIENGYFNNVESVCDAYKKIVKTVMNPIDEE